ncbi:MAG: hypothetical protein Kow0025_20940 [Thermodesulfovibrionales bacterium]
MEEPTGGLDDRALLRLFISDSRRAKRLSRAEEASLAREGTPEAQLRLVEANIALAVSLAARHRAPGAPVMDLVSSACLGLIQAARRYDPDGPAAFKTYAFTACRFEVLKALARERRHITISLDEPLSKNGDEIGTLGEALAAEEPLVDVEAEAAQGELREVLDRVLKKREMAVIQCRFWEGKTLEATAADLGVGKEAVRQCEVRALRKLRRALRRQGLTAEAFA